ncbi:MAG: AsmA family protein [Candidatus Krumholzibacteria bacterium]|nr:AsmA family protein [Candidatus Krumholzibacteria bacterium]
MKKKLLIAIGIVAVLVIVAAVVLLANINKVIESRRGEILARARDQVGRELSVGKIEAALWPPVGVRVNDVVIADDPAFSSEPFVRAKDVTVSVRILPLLRKRVEVKRFTLNEPSINIIRRGDGTVNFASLAGGEAAPGEAPADADAPAPAAAIPLVLAFADIRDGVVHVVDETKGLDHTVRDIDASARGVSLESEVSFSIAAAVVGEKQDVRVEGRAGPLGEPTPERVAAMPLAITAELGPMDGAALLRLIPPALVPRAVEGVSARALTLRAEVSGTPAALALEGFEAQAALFGAEKANVVVTASATGIDALDPAVSRERAQVKGRVEAGPIDLATVRDLAGRAGMAKPGFSLGGEMSGAADFSMSAGRLTLDATVDGEKAAIASADAFAKPAGTPMRLKMQLELEGQQLLLREVAVVLASLQATVRGAVDMDPTRQHMDLEVEVPETDAAGLAALLPKLAPLSPGGRVQARVRLSGRSDAQKPPLMDGTLTLSEVTAKLPQMPQPITSASATIALKGRGASVSGASLQVGHSVFRVEGVATELQPLHANFRVTSAEVLRADLTPPPPQKPPRPEVLREVAFDGTASAPDPERFELRGTVTSESGVLANIDYSDLRATIRSTKEELVIESYSARALDGTVEGKGTVKPDPVKPSFSIQTKVSRVNVAEYFRYKFPSLPRVLDGRVDLDLTVGGSGKQWEDVRTTLSGDGGGTIAQGVLHNVNVAQAFVDGVKTIPLVPAGFDQRLRAKYPKLFATDNTLFESLVGHVTISEGRVQSSDLVMETTDFTVRGAGWLSFDRRIDLKTTMILSQKLTQDLIAELPAARYLTTPQGRLFTGDAARPRLALDTQVVATRLQKALVDEGKDELQDKVKDLLKGIGTKKKP